jgi:hypothetical protein
VAAISVRSKPRRPRRTISRWIDFAAMRTSEPDFAEAVSAGMPQSKSNVESFPSTLNVKFVTSYKRTLAR